MRQLTLEELKEIIGNHLKWIKNEDGGERANLREADLRGADLSEADLRGADLREADLRGADLSEADLRGAYLCEANLRGAYLCEAVLRRAYLRGAYLCEANLREADLREANLSEADLCEANLSGANLREADLCEADLRGADLSEADLRGADLCEAKNVNYPIACPEEGEFTAFKKCRNNVIVKLLIPSDAKRSSATTRKCRASKAVVLEIFGADKAFSQHDSDFFYEVGKTVEPSIPFCENRWEECESGIHFFITRKEAEEY